MQYLLDQFPPPASTGSCSCFLVIVHSWGDTVFAADPDQEDTMVWVRLLTYFLLFCFCFFFNSFTSGLSCGTVYHLREKKKSLLDLVANLQNHGPEHVWQTCKITALSMYEGTDQESCWVCLLLYPLWCLVLIDSQGQVQVCFLSFIYVCTCTCPSHNDLYPSRLSHIWTRGPQSLSRPFKTNIIL